jgi:hypothetical protein
LPPALATIDSHSYSYSSDTNICLNYVVYSQPHNLSDFQVAMAGTKAQLEEVRWKLLL